VSRNRTPRSCRRFTDQDGYVRSKTVGSSLPDPAAKTLPVKPAGRRQSGLFRPVADEASNPFDPASTGPADIPLPNDIFDVRTSPTKRPDSQTSGSTVKAANQEPARRSPRKKPVKKNYADDERDEEVMPVETATVKGKERAVASPTKAAVKKRRSLKPVEGGLAVRLEAPAEAVDFVDESDNKVDADRLNELPKRGTREGEQLSVSRSWLGFTD
jgi:hypothetical protein